MNNELNFKINISENIGTAFSKINKALGNTTGFFKEIQGGANRTRKSIFSCVESFARFQTLNIASDSLNKLSDSGMNFEASLADLSAITGQTGTSLAKIGKAAQESAKQFGTNATQNVESYKLLLSKLSPDIAKNSEALKAMGDNVNILSKTMGGDTIAAAEVLTTAMNQYGVSLDDPIQASETMAKMMNIMAASAKVGSAEMPEIKQALEQVGMVAKNVGVSFGETNAAIQVLDKAGKKGAEAGTALRNVLLRMGEGRFMPEKTKKALEALGISAEKLGDTSLPLVDRLKMLKPVLKDNAMLSQLFGTENAAAGTALLKNAGMLQVYYSQILGTNTAQEQAQIVMESTKEKVAKLNAWIDNLKISLFNATGGTIAYAGALLDMVATYGPALTGLSSLLDMVGGLAKGMMWLTRLQNLQKIASMGVALWNGIVTASIWAQNAAWQALNAVNPLGWVIIGVSALVTGIMIAWNKFAQFRAFVKASWDYIKGIFTGDKQGFNQLYTAQLKVEEQVSKTQKNTQGAARQMMPAKIAGLDIGGATAAGSTSHQPKKTTEAIATGGTKNTTVNISIGKMGEFNIKEAQPFNTTTAKQFAEDMLDELNRVLGIATGQISL